MRKMFASFATLAVLLGSAVGLASPTQAVAPAVVLGAGPSRSDVPMLESYEKKMRANGTEAKALQAASARTANSEALKGNPRLPRKTSGAGGSAMASCGSPSVCYEYNGFGQDMSADPADATCVSTMTGKPYVDNSVLAGAHSLGQVAVESQDLGDNIEYGWIVDKTQRADGNPILFASHKINGVWKGYQTAWVDYADNPGTPTIEGAVNLGAGLPKPVAKKFCVQQTTTAFWVWYGDAATGVGDYVAYVPKSRWTPGGLVRPFNNTNAALYYLKFFNEAASHETESCIDMGTGTVWNASGTPTPPVTTWSDYSFGGSTITPNLFTAWGSPGITGVWGANNTSGTSGTAGGPGYNSAGTGPGTTAAC